MRVADTHIALFPERMVRQIVLVQIFADLAVGPFDDRVQFEHAVLALEHRQIFASRRMFAAQTGDPQIGTEFAQRAIHRLDLVDAPVFLESLDTLLPKFAIDGLLPRRRDQRRVDFEIESEFFRQLIGKAVGLGKKITRVDEDHRDLRIEARDQMQHDRSLHSEAGAEDRVAAEFFQGPTHAFGGRPRSQIAVAFGQAGVVVSVRQGGGHKKEPCRISARCPCGKKQITPNSVDHPPWPIG